MGLLSCHSFHYHFGLCEGTEIRYRISQQKFAKPKNCMPACTDTEVGQHRVFGNGYVPVTVSSEDEIKGLKNTIISLPKMHGKVNTVSSFQYSFIDLFP